MNKKWWSIFLLGLIFIIIYKINFLETISCLLKILTPFICAFILAYFLLPIKKKIELMNEKSSSKFLNKRAHGIAATITFSGAILVLVITLVYFVPIIVNNITDIVEKFPYYYSQTKDWFESFLKIGFISKLNLSKFFNEYSFQEIISKYDFRNLYRYMEGIINLGGSVFSIFMGFVVLAYILVEHKNLRGTLDKVLYVFFDSQKVKRFNIYMTRINAIFSRFFYGKLITSIIIGVMAIIGFGIFGVKYYFLMGIIILVSNMIPFFGPVIGGIPIIMVSFISGGPWQAFWVFVFIIGLQQIDGIILTPKIIGDTVGISGFWIIFSILIFGGLFGFWGLLLGVPIAACVKMIFCDYLEEKNNEKI